MDKKPKLKIRIARKLVDFLKKRRPIKKRGTPSRILIVSNTGIGDTLWGTPAIEALRKKYPQATICVLASSLSAQVLKNNPYIDEIINLKKGRGLLFFTHFFSLSKKKFDSILIFHTSYKWSVLLFYLLAPQHLLGYEHDTKELTPLLSKVFHGNLQHPIIQRLNLVKEIGAETTTDLMQLYLTHEEEKQAADFLASHHLPNQKKLIGLQPGASQLFKCWPLQNFIDLAQLIDKKLDAQMIVFGSDEEIPFAQEIQKKAPLIIAAGQLPLRASAALFKSLDLLITNDTGPLHLALALKTPLIVLFGPTPSSLCWPHLKSPLVKIIEREIPCIQCIRQRCKLPYCLERISAQEVFESIETMLKIH